MVTALIAAAVAVAVVMLMGAVLSRWRDTFAIVDVIWGLAFAVTTVAAGIVGLAGGHGTPWRTWLVMAMVAVWAARLASHLGRRTFSAAEDDPRYLKFMGGSAKEVPFLAILSKVYGLQGVLVLVVGLPVFVSAARTVAVTPLVWVGVAVWAAGVVIEAVADRQLAEFRKGPKGRILDTGLWSWSRHPNYFGDACLWWGLWLASGAASGWPVWLWTIVSPVVMTYILTFGSGVRIAEEHMRGRPGWDAYAARTSIFIPLPPKR